MRLIFLLCEVLTWAWIAACVGQIRSDLALTIAREIRPFMPVVFVVAYLYRAAVQGRPTATQIGVLVVCLVCWYLTRFDDDDRWKRRRKRLGRRVRAIAGGRRLVTT